MNSSTTLKQRVYWFFHVSSLWPFAHQRMPHGFQNFFHLCLNTPQTDCQEISLSLFVLKDRHNLVVNFFLANESSLWLPVGQMSLEAKLYNLQSRLLLWEKSSPFSLKSLKAFVQVQVFTFSQSFLFHPWWGFCLLGKAVRTPHIGVFLPRLIYLQGNLLSSHKIPQGKSQPSVFLCQSH